MMENVKTNIERQGNYKREYSRYIKAMKYGFYLEAISIIYAIIEDRLVSVLHHAGIVSRNQGDLKINKQVYPYMRKLMNVDENSGIKVKNVSVKITIIQLLLQMSEEEAVSIDNDVEKYVTDNKKRGIASKGYMYDLYKHINTTIDKKRAQDLFEEFKPWANDRNKLIHALLNKNGQASESVKKDCAETGYKLSRKFDDYLADPFRRKNTIRKKYKIQ